jgi:hypothetical protein
VATGGGPAVTGPPLVRRRARVSCGEVDVVERALGDGARAVVVRVRVVVLLDDDRAGVDLGRHRDVAVAARIALRHVTDPWGRRHRDAGCTGRVVPRFGVAEVLALVAVRALDVVAVVQSPGHERGALALGYSNVGTVKDGAAVTISCQARGTSVSGTYGTSNSRWPAARPAT